uniref:Pectate lyase n=1 Tax=Ananas comosus var. bracteatus TaxID=296719 RepID=A0A6V7PCY9_ANACO|nr:unnamed protein product [Ananas comosus var. bracteatus]
MLLRKSSRGSPSSSLVAFLRSPTLVVFQNARSNNPYLFIFISNPNFGVAWEVASAVSPYHRASIAPLQRLLPLLESPATSSSSPAPATASAAHPPSATTGGGGGGGRAPAAMATLPYAGADATLRALAGQAEGFGRNAIGGLHGAVYHVTSLADDGCGSLREGCRKKEPLWIVFEVSGTINLSSYLRVSSYKTIDGRGQRIKLTGKGLQLKECEHVIVCNLEFEGGRGHDVDGIQIKPKSRHIWIDRCSLRDFDDGLIDITGKAPTLQSQGAIFQCTTKQCLLVQIVATSVIDVFENWGIYAVCASVEAQILSQCNIYEAGQKKAVFKYMPEKAADREEVSAGWIRSEGDLFLNGAQPCLVDGPGVDSVFSAAEYYQKWTMESASPALGEILQLCAGRQHIPRPPDC